LNDKAIIRLRFVLPLRAAAAAAAAVLVNYYEAGSV